MAKTQSGGLKAPYFAPETELIMTKLEMSILSNVGTNDVPDLEEESGWGDSIWG